MSACVDLSDLPYFEWKGKTFNQVVAFRQMNINTNNSTDGFMRSGPIKLYRKEIASVVPNRCNGGKISIDDINNPGQTVTTNSGNGLSTVVDFNWINNTTEHPGECIGLTNTRFSNASDSCMTVESNARTRVRSAGMIKRNYNVNKNNDTYYTSSRQYLESRKRLFTQNQFNYIQSGNRNAVPGTPDAIYNIYSPNGINHCQPDGNNPTKPSYVQLYYKPNNPQYAQQGAVSSSSRIARLRYNTITDNGGKFASGIYGTATANALAYSSRDASYTIKEKVGYPNIQTPVIKSTGEVSCVCDGRQMP